MAIDTAKDGKRYREKYRNENLYVGLFTDGERLSDLTASISSKMINLDYKERSLIEALAKMTSLALRGHPPHYVAADLSDAAIEDDTIPAIFADLLFRWHEEHPRKVDDEEDGPIFIGEDE